MDWNNTPVLDSIQLPGSDTKYWMKDTEAREKIEALVNVTHFLGVTTTELTDGASTNPITINEQEVTAVSGDIAIYKKDIGLQEPLSLEFIFDGTYWQLLGGQSIEGAGDLAYKNSASGSYTPAGNVNLRTTDHGAGNIAVVTSVSLNDLTVYFKVDDEKATGIHLLTDVEVSAGSGSDYDTSPYASCITDLQMTYTKAGSVINNGTLPTLTDVTVNELTANISGTTLVIGTTDTSVSYSFNGGSFPAYSFAQINVISSYSKEQVLRDILCRSRYLSLEAIANIAVEYSGVTGTFTGSSATITVS